MQLNLRLKLLMSLSQFDISTFSLFQLRLQDVHFPINTSNFRLLLIEDVVELLLEFPLRLFSFFHNLLSELFLFLIEIFDLFIENFYMKLELLLHFDVISHISLVLL